MWRLILKMIFPKTSQENSMHVFSERFFYLLTFSQELCFAIICNSFYPRAVLHCLNFPGRSVLVKTKHVYFPVLYKNLFNKKKTNKTNLSTFLQHQIHAACSYRTYDWNTFATTFSARKVKFNDRIDSKWQQMFKNERGKQKNKYSSGEKKARKREYLTKEFS